MLSVRCVFLFLAVWVEGGRIGGALTELGVGFRLAAGVGGVGIDEEST